MEGQYNQEEVQLESQLSAITVATLLTFALILVTVLMGWEMWTLPFFLFSVIVMWFSHISQILPFRYRVPLYIILMDAEFFFYAVHTTSLLDMPVINIIIMFLCLALGSNAGICASAITYFVALIWHFAVLHSFGSQTAPLDWARIAMDVFAVTLMMFATRNVNIRRKRDREKLLAAMRHLEEVNTQTEDFMVNVSHELRTPINAVTGISSTLYKIETDEYKRTELLAVRRAGKRLFRQISDILDYSEIGMNRIKKSEQPYHISSMANDLCRILSESEAKPSVELFVDLDPRTPSLLFGDEGKIMKILWHLSENSIKYTHSGGVFIRISSVPTGYGINLNLLIQDTGVGMDERQLANAFNRFYQVDANRTRKASGIGLGLSVIAGLTKCLGGFLRTESTPGKGTTIQISIPQKVLDATPCISIPEDRQLCVTYFVEARTTYSPILRDFTERIVRDLKRGVTLRAFRTAERRELERLLETQPITHIFTDWYSYNNNKDLFDPLAERISITVVPDPGTSPQIPNIHCMQRPLFSLQIGSILSGEPFKSEGGDKVFVCPMVKALVVDDDEMNLMVAEGMLKGYKMDVDLALSGKAAIEKCRTQDYDIVFLDHMMPEMDGVECLHRLRKLNSHAQKEMLIVALTANAVSGAREMFLQEGFDAFIPKPIEPISFARVLRKVLPASKIVLVDEQNSSSASEKSLSSAVDMSVLQNQNMYTQLLEKLCASLEELDPALSASLFAQVAPYAPDEKVRDLLSKASQKASGFDFESALSDVRSVLEGGRS